MSLPLRLSYFEWEVMVKVDNLGSIWLVNQRERYRAAPSVVPKQNKYFDTASSKHRASLSGGRIINHIPAPNICGCQNPQQPIKQPQPSAFPSLISSNEKDDSLLYSHKGSLSIPWLNKQEIAHKQMRGNADRD